MTALDQSPSSSAAAKPAEASPFANFINGPILPTLLKLAAPNVVAFIVMSAVAIAEMWYVGQLGTAALAGFAVVFPLVMLMTMLSAGSIGGVIAAATARALGAGDTRLANRIVWHSMAIALLFTILFGVIEHIWGAEIASFIGAEGDSLTEALSYSSVAFGGMASVWFLNIFSSLLRGTGDMKTPAIAMVFSAILQIFISGALSLGWFGLPALGIAGIGWGLVLSMLVGCVLTFAKLASGNNGIRFSTSDLTFDAVLLGNLIRVGGTAAINPFISVSSVVLLTTLVSRFGQDAIAGYGIGARLEFIMIPIVFGLGAALISMVGTNIGAGKVSRAVTIGWTGAFVAAGVCGLIGIIIALFPSLWVGIFTDHPDVTFAATEYLVYVGPAYIFFGLGLSLYFASQGAHAVFWPMCASLVRLFVAVGIGGYIISTYELGYTELLYFVSGSLCLFGIIPALALLLGAWQRANPGGS
ncbi:MATE family efflux transporter [Sneathiella glossodoripedis]|uniref:MATE family efflux transporter n=1 Tax=Sneathiella glossodoripedis TaxID=418853 RepID=UPI0004723651|nr:MATE family efflux transporter [Sneathiella glossodoripedis]